MTPHDRMPMGFPPPPRCAPPCRLLAALAGHLLLIPIDLSAADGDPATPTQLPPLVVTGIDEPTAPSIQQAREDISNVPGGATVVDPSVYRQGTTGSISRLLNMVPGVFSEPQSGGQETRLSIRGSGISADDILGVIVMQDGIPINEGDGEADIEELDLGNIRYVEVYRGADALRYGGNGLGGALNLVSLTGKDVGPLSARLEGGSFGYHLEHVSAGGVEGPWDWIATIGDQGTNGYREHSAESAQRFIANIGYQLSHDWSNRVYLGYIAFERDYPDDLTKEQMEANPQQTDQDSISQDFYRHWYEARVSDKFSYVSGTRSLDIAASFNQRWWHESDPYNPGNPAGVWIYQSQGLAGDVTFVDRTALAGHDNQFTIGILPNAEVEPDHHYQNINGQAGPTIASDHTTATNIAVFAEDRYAVARQWSVVLGAQGVYARRTYEDTFPGSPDYDQESQQIFTGFNPKLGALFKPAEKIQIYGNVSRSFQAPSFDDLVQLQGPNPPLYPYVPLAAQKGTTVEVGTRSGMEGMEWDISLYRTWLRDELLNVYNQYGTPDTTVNATPTVHQGIEVGAELELLNLTDDRTGRAHHLVLEQSYTLNDFHFTDDPNYGHNRIAGIPINFYRARLIYQHPNGLYFGPTLEWNMSSYPVDNANSLDADPYVLLGARAGWVWNERLRVFVEGTNLTNKTYAAVVAPIQDARLSQDADPAIFRPGNGRSIVGGIEASW